MNQCIAWKCKNCQSILFPKTFRCSNCKKSDFDKINLLNPKLITFTVVSVTSKHFKPPIILGVIEYDCKIKIIHKINIPIDQIQTFNLPQFIDAKFIEYVNF